MACMVKLFLGCLFLIYSATRVEALPIIDASINSGSHAHFPLTGTITITHSPNEKIDSQSFELEGKPLEASQIKEVKMSAMGDTVVTLYSFQLPAQEKGLYVLSSLSVKIDGKRYTTVPSTYEVGEDTPSPPPLLSSSARQSTPLIFSLQAQVKGPSTLYPGQRTQLFYQISYNRDVDLTRSILPMIHPAHLKKIGDVHIQDYQLKDVTVQQLIQEVEANTTGTFSFGPSSIEGYTYTVEGKEKVYDPPLLRAEAPIVTLNVEAFPHANQPLSFTGGIGRIQGEAHLLSSPSLTVGERIQLQVEVKGIENLNDFRFPFLPCQPGFSGFFQMDDLAPLAEVKNKSKFFYVELRPLNAFIHHIPSIELSSFDPASKTYLIQHTSPIPLTVANRPLEKTPKLSLPLLTSFSPLEKWPPPTLSPLETEDTPPPLLLPSSPPLLGWGMGSLLLAIVLLLLQHYGHRHWPQHQKVPLSTSEHLLKEGLKTMNLQIIELAFWHLLWERNILPKTVFDLESLLSHPHLQKIGTFIFQLQALQYGSSKIFDEGKLKQTAEQLFILLIHNNNNSVHSKQADEKQ